MNSYNKLIHILVLIANLYLFRSPIGYIFVLIADLYLLGSPVGVTELILIQRYCWTESKYIHKFITQLPKDYYLIPDNGAIKLVGPDQSIHTSL